jgi:hypothetical protein
VKRYSLSLTLVLDLLFFLFLILLFFGTGRAFLDLIRWRSSVLAFTLPSCIGITIATVAVTWFYQLGGSLTSFFWVISIAVATFLFWRLSTLPFATFHLRALFKLEYLLVTGFAMLILLPALLGGTQFTIFRSNQDDAFNYLEAAITYREQSFANITHWSSIDFVSRGLFPFSQVNLAYRPEISFLYSALSCFRPSAFLSLHYVFLVYFQFITFCGTCGLASEVLKGRHRIIAILLAAGVVGGFWGQYILDIDAWSQFAFMPLATCSLVLLIKILQNQTNAEKPDHSAKFSAVYCVSWIGLFYMYPEGAIFILVAHTGCFIAGLIFFRLRISWRHFLISVSVFCCLMIPVLQGNVLFLKDQTNQALMSLDW